MYTGNRRAMYLLIYIIYIIIKLEAYSPNCRTGKRKCKPEECTHPDDLKCKGNIGLDVCNCCKVCLRQENEMCGVSHIPFGMRCDHAAPYCVRIPELNLRRCMSLETAIRKRIPKFTRKMEKCRTSVEYAAYYSIINCYTSGGGPNYYCKKKSKRNFLIDDCCIHGNSCHPNEDLYEKID